MPASIRAYTLTDHNDDYNVYVNDALNSIEQQKAINHELKHIKGEHFFRISSVATDEAEAGENTATGRTPVKVKPVEKKRQPRDDFKKLRLSAGLSQYQLARLAGIRPSAYAEYELGIRPCPKEDERQILSVLNKK
jgi:DNA-binding transcriptional regulator YiaG